jgi:CTP:molybdopterin cytidylyltransferase MocA
MKDVTHHIIDDPMIRLDINTPEAYEDAKQKYLM